MTQDNRLLSRNLLVATVPAALFVLALVLLGQFFSFSLYEDASYLSTGWTLTHNGQTEKQVNLENYVFPTIRRGDTVTLRATLPQLPDEAQEMQIRIWHSTIAVSVDGRNVFSYGQEALAAGKPVGGGYQWISLPHGAGGQSLEIQLQVTEYGAFSQFAPPMLYPARDMLPDFLRQNSLMAIIGLFLFALGLVLLLFAAFLLWFRRDSVQLLWIALLSLLIGSWVLCRYGIFQVISENAQLNYYLEYLSLYLTPPMGLLCVYSFQEKRRRMPAGILLFFALNLLYVPILLVLHGLGILQLAEALGVSHVFILIDSGFLFFYVYLRRKQAEERIKLLGVSVLTLFAVMDLLLYFWENVISGGVSGIQYSLAAIGAVLFILILLLNYGLSNVQTYFAQAETAALKKLAYTDPLTGLANRAKYNELMDRLAASPVGREALLLFDLNNLKETNDRLGHEVGDSLIRSFAAILRESFAPLGTVARIGGDEFTVLIPGGEEETVNAALKALRQGIAAYNALGPAATLSVAFGSAYRREGAEGLGPEALYRTADKRMYAMKYEMKRQMPD